MTTPARVVCTPWATIADLPASRPALDDDTWNDMLIQASELLYLWSGRQYSGGCVSTVVLDTPPGAGAPCWHWAGSPWPQGRDRGIRDQVVALLPDSPVTSIELVEIDEVELVEGTEYTTRLPAGMVWLVGDRQWPTDGTARITYRHGIMPPIGGVRAAVLLAIELGKSWSGAKCNLPKRIESITREGLTIGMVTSLQGWRTGIWDIDAWLSSVNPGMATRPARAWSPDAVHGHRTTT